MFRLCAHFIPFGSKLEPKGGKTLPNLRIKQRELTSDNIMGSCVYINTYGEIMITKNLVCKVRDLSEEGKLA